MKFTKEQIEKAKAAKSVEELLALAKENGIELTEEEVTKYFAMFRKEGELADEELSNVAGGTCYSSGVTDPYVNAWRQYAIVSPWNFCPYYSLACTNCDEAFTVGGTWYCSARWITQDGEVFHGQLVK